MYPGRYARTAPDRPAVVMAGSGEVVTYRQLDERSLRLARVLRGWGLRTGGHIALIAENHPRYFEVYWAAIRSGLYVTAVNRYLAAGEAAYVVTDCGASVLVVSHGVADLAAGLLAGTPGVRRRLMFDGTIAGHSSYEDAVAGVSAEPPADEPRGSIMLYSSGTTGRPKGIEFPLSGRRVDDPDNPAAHMLSGIYGMGADTVYLSPAPLYHSAPLVYSTGVQSLGGTVVVMERFEPEEALRAIERRRVTHSQWVPTMFIRMLRLPEEVRRRYDLSSHRVAIHAAAPCPVEVKRAMIDWWGPVLHEYYAATEGIGTTHIAAEEWLERPGSVGRPIAGVLHVCGEDGVELPRGEIGTIYFDRGEVSFRYHGDPEKTRQSRHAAHPSWVTVGDVGYLDSDGYLYLTDRRTDMIISGGVNIYPREVEDCLVLHPEVADVAVFGVPNAEMGEEVKAVVQPADGAVAGPGLAADLIGFARDRIAHYKLPRSVDFAAELPRSPTGKLYKRLLRDRYLREAAESSTGSEWAGSKSAGSKSAGGGEAAP